MCFIIKADNDCSSDLTKYTEFSDSLINLSLVCSTSAAKRQQCNKLSPECHNYTSYEPLEQQIYIYTTNELSQQDGNTIIVNDKLVRTNNLNQDVEKKVPAGCG